MSDYIKREDAIKAFCYRCLIRGKCKLDEVYCLPRKKLDEIPAADVRENVRGEWVFEKGDGKTCVDGWVCTNCKCSYHTNVPYFSEYKYCPNCGAIMRGDQDGA